MKKALILLMAMALCLCAAQPALGESALFPIRENGVWGYMNDAGEIVIAPQFAWAGAFRGAGYAVVEAVSASDDMYANGIINSAGKYVVEPKYSADEGYDGYYYGGKDTGVIWLMAEDDAGIGFFDVASGCFSGAVFVDAPFHVSDSRLIAVSDGEKTGFADRTTGKLVIKYQYEDTGSQEWSFNNGYAYVETEDQNGDIVPLMIDESGKKVSLPSGYEPAEGAYVEEGLFPVLETDTNLYGYADTNGKIAIEPIYDEASFFTDGWASVMIDGESIAINAKGEIIDMPEPKTYDGLSIDLTGDTDYPSACVVDANDNVIVPVSAGYQFDISYDFGCFDFFTEGVQVLVKDGQYGFLDETGAVAIPFEYDYASNFENGLAFAEKDGHLLYLNHAGEIVWQEK